MVTAFTPTTGLLGPGRVAGPRHRLRGRLRNQGVHGSPASRHAASRRGSPRGCRVQTPSGHQCLPEEQRSSRSATSWTSSVSGSCRGTRAKPSSTRTPATLSWLPWRRLPTPVCPWIAGAGADAKGSTRDTGQAYRAGGALRGRSQVAPRGYVSRATGFCCRARRGGRSACSRQPTTFGS